MARELLNDMEVIPDLTKADIFSFGATIYGLMINSELPKNGLEWQELRNGNLHRIENLSYSNSLKSIVKAMMHPDPDQRPSAHDLLSNHLQSDIELELRWEKK